jgi:hypothetical protein
VNDRTAVSVIKRLTNSEGLGKAAEIIEKRYEKRVVNKKKINILRIK